MRLTKSSIALSCAALVALSGCEDMGQRQATGAATGAVLGGLFGATRQGGNVGTAAVGAVVGGVIGGAIGQALDKQAGDLRSSFDNDQIDVVNTGSELIVTMPNDILFATDSAVVSVGLQQDLAALARNLQQYPNSTIEVIGHTDNVGDATYNLDLSQRRPRPWRRCSMPTVFRRRVSSPSDGARTSRLPRT